MRHPPAFVAAGHAVLGGFTAAVVMASSPSFLGGARGVDNPSTEGLASSGPTPDSGGGAVVATIPVGDYPRGVAYDPGNGYIYVANTLSNNVSVISGRTVVATNPVGNQARRIG